MSDDANIFDRGLIARRRDRLAPHIDAHSFLLERVADDLAERLTIVRRSFPLAVSLGAAHGVVARRIREVETVGAVFEAERAPTLASRCAGPVVVADDDYLPFADASLDLVLSGLTLQLVNDLPGALVQVRRALKGDGLFLAALLGGRTLDELRQAWLAAEAEVRGGVSPRVAPFADTRDLGGLLQRAGFALPVVDSETLTVAYPTPLHLMREIKAMGGSNPLRARSRVPVTRGLLMRAAEIYAERFQRRDGKVEATFEIMTLTAWTPHESQQKPLRPGSATTRLADALGVGEQKLKP